MDQKSASSLCDLHIHVGAAVAPHVMWSIAHARGFKLPVKDYWEFCDLVTASPDRVQGLDAYLEILHRWTERIQSSPAAIERSVYEIIGKEYRGSRVTQIELRFNPMKRNEGGERDLDHIIFAALIGMERAMIEYDVKAGLIFCLAREFPPELNSIIVDKAIRYRSRGVVGIDLAGTEAGAVERREDPVTLAKYAGLFARARDAGLGTTVHTGETPHTDALGVAQAVRALRPSRIGHGIRAAYSDEAMDAILEQGCVLEICPSSNLMTGAVRDLEELRHVLGVFRGRGVPLTINTDGPYLLRTNLRGEYDLLERAAILDAAALDACTAAAFRASFVK